MERRFSVAIASFFQHTSYSISCPYLTLSTPSLSSSSSYKRVPNPTNDIAHVDVCVVSLCASMNYQAPRSLPPSLTPAFTTSYLLSPRLLYRASTSASTSASASKPVNTTVTASAIAPVTVTATTTATASTSALPARPLLLSVSTAATTIGHNSSVLVTTDRRPTQLLKSPCDHRIVIRPCRTSYPYLSTPRRRPRTRDPGRQLRVHVYAAAPPPSSKPPFRNKNDDGDNSNGNNYPMNRNGGRENGNGLPFDDSSNNNNNYKYNNRPSLFQQRQQQQQQQQQQPLHSSPDAEVEQSYLQCPQCRAVYQVDPDELDDTPRVVACSSCLHEWYASEDVLLWGDNVALNALVQARKDNTPPYVRKKQSLSSSKKVNNKKKWQDDRSNDSTNDKISEGGGEIEGGADSSPSGSNQQQNDVEALSSDSNAKQLETKSDRGDRVVDSVSPIESEDPKFASNTVGSGNNQSSSSSSTDGPHNRDTEINNNSNVKSQEDRQENGTDQPKVDLDDAEKSDDTIEDDGRPYVIFIGNLSFRATEEDLYRAFSGYGVVEHCQVPCAVNGSPRGYGFVKMATAEAGNRAIQALQGASIVGRDVTLSRAKRPIDGDNNGRDSPENNTNSNVYNSRNNRDRDGDRWRGDSQHRQGHGRQRQQAQTSTNQNQRQHQQQHHQLQQPQRQQQQRQQQNRQRHGSQQAARGDGRDEVSDNNNSNKFNSNKSSSSGNKQRRPWYRRNSNSDSRDSQRR